MLTEVCSTKWQTYEVGFTMGNSEKTPSFGGMHGSWMQAVSGNFGLNSLLPLIYFWGSSDQNLFLARGENLKPMRRLMLIAVHVAYYFILAFIVIREIHFWGSLCFWHVSHPLYFYLALFPALEYSLTLSTFFPIPCMKLALEPSLLGFNRPISLTACHCFHIKL